MRAPLYVDMIISLKSTPLSENKGCVYFRALRTYHLTVNTIPVSTPSLKISMALGSTGLLSDERKNI